MCPKSCKRSDNLPFRDIFNGFCTLFHNFFKPIGCCFGSFFIRNIGGCRPDQQIPMHSRRHEHSFSFWSRDLENRTFNQIARVFIQQTILPSAWSNMDFFPADHVVKYVRIHSSRIDQESCFEHSFIGQNTKSILHFLDLLHLCLQMKLNSILHCIFCIGEIHFKWTYDSTGGDMNRCIYGIGQIRLQKKRLTAAQHLHSLNSILFTALHQLLEYRHLFLALTHDHSPVAPERKIQFLRHLIHHLISQHIQLRLQCSRFRIKSPMHDTTVGFAGAFTYITFLLQYTNIQFISGELSCHCTSRYTGSDNDDIFHFRSSSLGKSLSVLPGCSRHLQSTGKIYTLILSRNFSRYNKKQLKKLLDLL